MKIIKVENCGRCPYLRQDTDKRETSEGRRFFIYYIKCHLTKKTCELGSDEDYWDSRKDFFESLAPKWFKDCPLEDLNNDGNRYH